MADDESVADDALNSAQEKQVKELVAKAKKNGEIAQRDIFAVFPDTPENVDVLDTIYTELADAAIKIIDASAQDAQKRGGRERRRRVRPPPALGVKT